MAEYFPGTWTQCPIDQVNLRVECKLTGASDYTVCHLRPDLYPYVFPSSTVEDCQTAAEAQGWPKSTERGRQVTLRPRYLPQCEGTLAEGTEQEVHLTDESGWRLWGGGNYIQRCVSSTLQLYGSIKMWYISYKLRLVLFSFWFHMVHVHGGWLILAVMTGPVCVAVACVSKSDQWYGSYHNMEAPARHKGGITSRRNYLCDTTQLFASRRNSNCIVSLNSVVTQFDLRRIAIRIVSCC